MLTKKELREKIANKSELTVKEVGKVLDSTVDVVLEQLKAGEKVSVHGLCTFNPVPVAAGERTFRNPKTGEKVTKFYEATTNVKVKVEKSLLRAVKGE